jgi:hypothetical protein
MKDEMLAKLENVLGSARARLITAETGYTAGKLREIEEALAAVRAERGAKPTNPYLLTGEELRRTETRRKAGA